MTRRLVALTPVLLLALCACGSDPSTVTVPSPAPSAPGSPPTPAATSVASGVASDTADQTISVTVAAGKVTGPTERVAVTLGSRLRITVTADAADKVHVHVYDLEQAVSPGSPVSITFVADKPGPILVELEEAHLTLVRLIVS